MAMPGSWTGVQAAARTAGCSCVRGGELRAPGDSGPIQGFATRVCAGQGSDDPFSSGRSRSAGTLRLPVGSGMAVAGVITTRAAHRRLTGSRLDGVRWGVNKVPGQDCGPPRAAVAACPVPGAGLGGSYVPGERAGPGFREWWCRCLAWIILAQALSALCFLRWRARAWGEGVPRSWRSRPLWGSPGCCGGCGLRPS